MARLKVSFVQRYCVIADSRCHMSQITGKQHQQVTGKTESHPGRTKQLLSHDRGSFALTRTLPLWQVLVYCLFFFPPFYQLDAQILLIQSRRNRTLSVALSREEIALQRDYTATSFLGDVSRGLMTISRRAHSSIWAELETRKRYCNMKCPFYDDSLEFLVSNDQADLSLVCGQSLRLMGKEKSAASILLDQSLVDIGRITYYLKNILDYRENGDNREGEMGHQVLHKINRSISKRLKRGNLTNHSAQHLHCDPDSIPSFGEIDGAKRNKNP